MLATQVQYWTLQETKRHNVAAEDLGNRTLSENIRHNVVVEGETQRHNIAQEDYWSNSLEETRRHNLATEGLNQQEVDISRFRAFTDQRNAAVNEMNAETQRINAGINARNADTNAYNARTNRFGTYANYNLGIDRNRIDQQNADTREREERDRWLEWNTRERGVGVDQENASTNALNALTNQTKSETEQAAQNLNERQFKWKQFTDTVGLAIDAAKTANNAIENVLELVH